MQKYFQSYRRTLGATARRYLHSDRGDDRHVGLAAREAKNVETYGAAPWAHVGKIRAVGLSLAMTVSKVPMRIHLPIHFHMHVKELTSLNCILNPHATCE